MEGVFQVIRVGIIGASGYGGGELVRILAGHPEVELAYLSSETYKGRDISAALPNMLGLLEAECEGYDPDIAIERCDLLFLAQHNGWAMKEAGRFLDAGIKIVDLSADFRLREVGDYEQWYNLVHSSPKLIDRAVYGLPELYSEEIAAAELIANPGCYVTSAILALSPLLKQGLVKLETIIVDSLSGVSGAGRSSFKLDYHFPELNENVKAYNIGTHRHTPEIEQELSVLAGSPVTISFTPHLIPITRGILTTAYAELDDCEKTTEEMVDLYREFYSNAPFVVVLDAGEYPATKNVLGSNFCHIGLKVDPRTGRVVVLSAIDNLVKGMAGQAVQNMNLMCGFDETTALGIPGVRP
jgi:N-acetyl-gamma-glutamyl-phosphate reductase